MEIEQWEMKEFNHESQEMELEWKTVRTHNGTQMKSGNKQT